jgi:hypothetical protein
LSSGIFPAHGGIKTSDHPQSLQLLRCSMKLVLFFFLISGMGLQSFKIMHVEEYNTNYEKMEDSLKLLSNEEDVVNYNVFEEKIGKELQKRLDAVIGTEYWGRKKQNMRKCFSLRILSQKSFVQAP